MSYCILNDRECKMHLASNAIRPENCGYWQKLKSPCDYEKLNAKWRAKEAARIANSTTPTALALKQKKERSSLHKDDIRIRRLSVLRLKEEGLKPMEIAEQLGISRQLVANDLSVMKKELK